jgi:hypothetical protein
LQRAETEDRSSLGWIKVCRSGLAGVVAEGLIEGRFFIVRPRLCVCVLCACFAAIGRVLPTVSPYFLCFQRG